MMHPGVWLGMVCAGLLVSGLASAQQIGSGKAAVKGGTHRGRGQWQKTAPTAVEKKLYEDRLKQQQQPVQAGAGAEASSAPLVQAAHTDNMDVLRERLVRNWRLSEVQKMELCVFFESQFREQVVLRAPQHADQLAVFDTVANDHALDMNQKKAAFKEHFESHKGAVPAAAGESAAAGAASAGKDAVATKKAPAHQQTVDNAQHPVSSGKNLADFFKPSADQ